MRTWVDVAILAKSRNLDGRFVARAAAGLPFLLEEGDTVSLVPPKLDVPRTVTVSHVVLLDDDRAEITFDEVDDAGVVSLRTQRRRFSKSTETALVFSYRSLMKSSPT